MKFVSITLKDVQDEWKNRVFRASSDYTERVVKIYNELMLLEEFDKEKIDTITNGCFTRDTTMICSECRNRASELVYLGGAIGYDVGVVGVCRNCIAELSELIK